MTNFVPGGGLTEMRQLAPHQRLQPAISPSPMLPPLLPRRAHHLPAATKP